MIQESRDCLESEERMELQAVKARVDLPVLLATLERRESLEKMVLRALTDLQDLLAPQDNEEL